MTIDRSLGKGPRVAALAARLVGAAGLVAVLGGCNTTVATDTTGGIPLAYSDRHPISVREGQKSLRLFVGAGRGGLSPVQRAEVLAFAQNWKREATGGIIVERPSGGASERSTHDTLREAMSILAQAGVPPEGVGIRPIPATTEPAVLRFRFPLTKAVAGPCGLWPDDLGPTYDAKHFDNRQYYNFGCATQRNLASMVAEPADFVQPRAEAPSYTAKRTFGTEKWRKGESPATTYPDATKGAISDLGK